MTYAPKPNTGMLWPNDYKTADNQPDKRGDLFLDRALLKRLMNSDADLIKLTVSGWFNKYLLLIGINCLKQPLQIMTRLEEIHAPALFGITG